MEALVNNITGTCPASFGGATGGLFAQAVASLVAAHCAIASDTGRWPLDKAEDILGSAADAVSYDFIVVGAGTAGSLLASRLSTMFPTWSILLLEAGDDPGLESEIPAFLFRSQNTNIDWNNKTHPNLNHCRGFNGNSCIWSKGRAMGGSGSINAMLYTRGHPEDYNNWKDYGNIDWGYSDVQPYFERVEEIFNVSKCKNIEEDTNPWYAVLTESWRDIVKDAESLGNNLAGIGTRVIKLLVADGMRLNTGKVSLNSTSHKNLHVIKNTMVQRIIIDSETRSARGVEIKHASGVVMQIEARREVVLSAGSIGTPHILMLSGIGPADHLSHIGIETVVSLPVGKNLQDHAFFPLLLQINKSLSYSLTTEVLNAILLQYMMTKSGPLTNLGITDFMSFVDTTNETGYPDIQFFHTFFLKEDNFLLKPYFKSVGYTDEILKSITEINKEHSILGIYPTLLHPQSRGEILLTGKDITSQLIIKANYFQEPEDIRTMIRAIRIIQTLLETKKFKEFGVTLPVLEIQACSIKQYDSDEYWECYVRHMGNTVYHPVGTAKMGPAIKGDCVVSSSLHVHGVKNLRIVDASVMHRITGGNTMAPTLMIAEKASDIIKEHYTRRYRDEL